VTTSEEFVEVEEVAAYFGVTTHAVYKWARQGRIETRRLGRAVRITRAEFDHLKAHGLRDPKPIAENKLSLVTAP
jgi:excisionase family DNA binding protein